jgi:transcriptional regulator PpsR
LEGTSLHSPPGRGELPLDLLDTLDPSNVAAMLSAAADIVLVVTVDGVICDNVLSAGDLSPEIFIGWPGKAWIDTVTVESRSKISQLLRDAAAGAPPRWRQVNHPVRGGADIPVSYSAMRAGPHGHIVAIGRDMRPVANLQQRLLAAEQSIEQEYARLRHTETRYRLLLQMSSEAVLIVDARSGRVIEANPAAANLLRRPVKRLTGAAFTELVGGSEVEKIEAMTQTLRVTGRADDISVSLADGQQAIAAASLFRQDNTTFFLVRLVPLTAGAEGIVLPRAKSTVIRIIEDMPDAFVVTGTDRRILAVNTAFLDIAQLGSEEQARGEPVDRWLGRPGVDTNLLLGSLKDNGSVRQFQTIMRGQFGTVEDVEVSGVSVPEGDVPCFGLVIRRVPRRASDASRRSDRALNWSVEELTKLVGKVPLKELVRETTDIIERMCIEAALQLNENNRAGAADMLGLSRQSLYIKLHRYGIDDAGGNDD